MRNKTGCLILFIFAAIIQAKGQQAAPGIKWQKTFGGNSADNLEYLDTNVVSSPKVSLIDRDGGYIIAGQTSSLNGDITGNHGGTDIWVAKLDSSKNIIWKVCLGGSFNETFGSLQLAADSGYIITGSASSNDGDVTGIHGNSSDVWVVRLGNKGNIIWQKAYGGTDYDAGRSITRVGDSGYIFLATTYGNNGDATGVTGITDIWAVRINNTGDIIWKRMIGGLQAEEAGNIKPTPDGGFILTGTASSVTLPGYHLGSNFTPDILVVKLDKDGNIIWQKCYGGTRNETAGDVELTIDGNYIISGTTNSIDGDVTGYTSSQYSHDAWIVKLSATGSIIWQKCFGGPAGDAVSDLLVMPDNTYVGAGYIGAPTGGIFHHGYYDYWLLKFDQAGNKIWEKAYGGSSLEGAASIAVNSKGNFVVLGSTYSNDQEVSGNHGDQDLWLFETGNVNTIAGYTFFDANSDGIKNNNETFFDGLIVSSQKGSNTRSAIPYNGMYIIDVDTGTYITHAIPYNNYYTAVPATKTSTFSSFSNIDSANFAIQPIPGKRDVNIALWPYSGVRPGFPVQYRLFYSNVGTDTVSGSVKLIKDPRLNFTSANPAQTSVSSDTITWNFTNLYPNQQKIIEINFQALAPPQLIIGDVVLTKAWLAHNKPDLTPANDTAIMRDVVRGSYDPNDKTERNGGIITPAHINGGKYLNYLVRFQNTGTDTAFTVVIRDTLDARLDWNSLQMTAASHAYSLQIENGDKLTWTFNNIKLPDSNINEPASHGFVSYRIKIKNTVGVGDTVKNAAGIYFDFNLPVQTNIHRTVVKPPVITSPIVTGVLPQYCNNQGVETIKVTNPPVLASGITLTVKLSGNTLSMGADSTLSFNVSTLPLGIHPLIISFSNGAETTSTRYDIVISETVTPDVNVTANITNVTNLTLPVTVTAVNAASGGNTPLYTFAKDRTFTNILQAEGSSNTLPVTPSNLVIGDNWIYVRMKTSAPCYSAQTNTDSINIRRDQSTGIIDLDNPNQPINIYPNPFKKQIFINGLNAGKIYILSIYNLQGQLLYTKRIINQANINIHNLEGVSGVYWLTIYDEKRKRSMGSIKLIRE